MIGPLFSHPGVEERPWRLLVGDAEAQLATLPDASAQTCITSPPYFGLRDYGALKQIGLEASPDEFVDRLVEVFRQVRRVLRDDGTLWLNLGDSYAGTGRSGGGTQGATWERAGAKTSGPRGGRWNPPPNGLPPKSLIGIPWMVAFALRADGWLLRQEIIWAKSNPMPESVRDRCTKSHEHIFLLAKGPTYHFDGGAIQEPASRGHRGSTFDAGKTAGHQLGRAGGGIRSDTGWRNRRSVWRVATAAFPGAHFATFPPDLVRPCVLAGAPAGSTVLDPFAGSGTTGLVALGLGRRFVGIELNPEYAAMAEARLRGEPLACAAKGGDR